MMTLTISTDLTIAGGSPTTAPHPDAALPDAAPAPAPDVRQRFEQLLRQSTVDAPFTQDTTAQRQHDATPDVASANAPATTFAAAPDVAPANAPATTFAAAPDEPPAAMPQDAPLAAESPNARPAPDVAPAMSPKTLSAPQHTPSVAESPNARPAPDVAPAMSLKTLSAPPHTPFAAESPNARPAPDEPSASVPQHHTPSAAESSSASAASEVPLAVPLWPVAETVVAVASPEGASTVEGASDVAGQTATSPQPLVPPSGLQASIPSFAAPSVAAPVVGQGPSAPVVEQPVGQGGALPSPVPSSGAVVSEVSAGVEPVVTEQERPLTAQPLPLESSSVAGVSQPLSALSGVERPEDGVGVTTSPLPPSMSVAMPSVSLPSAEATRPPAGASAAPETVAERPLVWGQPVEVEGERQTLTVPSAPSLVQAFPVSDTESAEEPGGTVGQQQAVVLVCQAWLTQLPPQAAAETPAAPSRPSVSVFGDASQPLPFAVQSDSSESDGLPSLTAYVLTARGSVCETRLPLAEAEALLARFATAVPTADGGTADRAPSQPSSTEPSHGHALSRTPEPVVRGESSGRRRPVLLLVAPPETPMTLADVQDIAAETLPRLATLAGAPAPTTEHQASPQVAPRTDSPSPTVAQAMPSSVAPQAPEATARVADQSQQARAVTPERPEASVPSAERAVRRQASADESTEVARAGVRRQTVPSLAASPVSVLSQPSPAVVTVDLRSPVAPLLSRELSDSARAALLLQVADGVAEAVVMRPSLVWGEGEVLVRLSPEVLGGTEIRLRVADGGLVVRLSPSLETVTAQLQAAQPQLQAWLAERLAVYHQRIRVEVRPASHEERDA